MRLALLVPVIAVAMFASGSASNVASAAEHGRFCLSAENTHEHSCAYNTMAACRFFANPEHATCTLNPEFGSQRSSMRGMS